MKKKIVAVLLTMTLFVQGFSGHTIAAENTDDSLQPNDTEATENDDTDEMVSLSAKIDEVYDKVDLDSVSDDEFGTKTLIVQSETENFDTLGATETLSLGDDMYLLTYADSASAKTAYDTLSTKDGIVSVEPDRVVEIEDASDESVMGTEEMPSTEGNAGTEIVPDSDNQVLITEEKTDDSFAATANESLLPTEEMSETDDKESTETVTETTNENLSTESTEKIDTESNVSTEATEESVAELADNSVVRVAVVDTGIDLDGNKFQEYIESTDGANVQDENGHGTQVTGLIAQILSQNNITSDDAKIIPVKVADQDGKCTVSQLYTGMELAIAKNADFINVSMGTKNTTASVLIGKAVKDAEKKNITVVTSAGNSAEDVAGFSPANIESVITVTSVDNNKSMSVYSNYGNTVDCAEYGEDIPVYGLNGKESKESGTSYAAALVTGALASDAKEGLVTDPKSVTEYIQFHSEDLGDAGFDTYYGYGLFGDYVPVTENTSETEKDTETEEISDTETETETEVETETETENDTEESEYSPEYYEKAHELVAYINMIKMLTSNDNFESSKYLINSMNIPVSKYFKDKTNVQDAVDQKCTDASLDIYGYSDCGNEEIDSSAKEVIETLYNWKDGHDFKLYREKMEAFQNVLSKYQKSEPLSPDVYIEASSNTVHVKSAAELQAVINGASAQGVKGTTEIVCVLDKNITTDVGFYIGAKPQYHTGSDGLSSGQNTSNVHIKIIAGKGNTISFKFNSDARKEAAKYDGTTLFYVSGDTSVLTLGDAEGNHPVILDGKNCEHNGFLIYAGIWATANGSGYEAKAVLNKGVELKNNIMYYKLGVPNKDFTHGSSGSAICSYGSVEINGAKIHNNTFAGTGGIKNGEGAAVAAYHKFKMTSGEIYDNIGINGSGLLFCRLNKTKKIKNSTSFVITGGNIHDNGYKDEDDKRKAILNGREGGGILIYPDTEVTIGASNANDLQIHNNYADTGSGIANYGTLKLGKCKISNNWSISEGGGILNRAPYTDNYYSNGGDGTDVKAGTPELTIDGAYVYDNTCGSDKANYAGGIASLKRTTASGKEITPEITIKSGYFYHNDGFSLHINGGTLNLDSANTYFGFKSYKKMDEYEIDDDDSQIGNYGGSGIYNDGATVNIKASVKFFVPGQAYGIKNTGTLNINEGANTFFLCSNDEAISAIYNAGKFTVGNITQKTDKDGKKSTVYPLTIYGSASDAIKNAGNGTCYVRGCIRGDWSVTTTKAEEDTSLQGFSNGIYNVSKENTYSGKNPYAVIFNGNDIEKTKMYSYIRGCGNGISNNVADGKVKFGQGKVFMCGTGLRNSAGTLDVTDADSFVYSNSENGISNAGNCNITGNAKIGFSAYKSISYTADTTAGTDSGYVAAGNDCEAINNSGTMNISGGMRVFSDMDTAITNSGTGTMTFSKDSDTYLLVNIDGENAIENSGTLKAEGKGTDYSCTINGTMDTGVNNTGTLNWGGKIDGSFIVDKNGRTSDKENPYHNITTGINNNSSKQDKKGKEVASFELYDNALITNCGTGIYAKKGKAVLKAAEIENCNAHGIENRAAAQTHIGGTDIHDNTNADGSGAGIYNYGKLYFNSGLVHNNKAHAYGGGIMNKAGADFRMNGGMISGNKAEGIKSDGTVNADAAGGGIHNEAADATKKLGAGEIRLYGGYIHGNNGYGVSNRGKTYIATQDTPSDNKDICFHMGASSYNNWQSYTPSANTKGNIHNEGLLQFGKAGAKHTYARLVSDDNVNIYNTVKGTVNVLENTTTTNQTELYGTGTGIYNNGGTVNLRTGLNITSPSAQSRVGIVNAVHENSDKTKTVGTVNVTGGTIEKGSTGISNAGTVAMSKGTITGNSENGVTNDGTFTLTGGTISKNTGHGVIQNGTFNMSGAAVVDASNDVQLAYGKIITINNKLTTSGVVAKVNPVKTDAKGNETSDITTGRIIAKAMYTGGKGSTELFYNTAQASRFELVLKDSNDRHTLRPGDYMDKEIVKQNSKTIADTDIVISEKHTVTYDKNIHEVDENGKEVDVAVANLPAAQTKYWCENLILPYGVNKKPATPTVTTYPYSDYFKFLGWYDFVDDGDKYDAAKDGHLYVMPYTYNGWKYSQKEKRYVYSQDEDLTLYASWQRNIKMAYIGFNNTQGDNFIDGGTDGNGIAMSSNYTLDDNKEADDKDNFAIKKDVKTTIVDKYTGKALEQTITGTVVGWGTKNAKSEDAMYDLNEEDLTKKIYDQMNRKSDTSTQYITAGAPNDDYYTNNASLSGFVTESAKTKKQSDKVSLFAMKDTDDNSNINLFAAAGMPYVNLYAVYDYGPTIEAYDMYYSLKDAQKGKITENELLSHAEAYDDELKTSNNPKGKLKKLKDDTKHTEFTIWDYSSTDFTSLKHEGMVTETFRAKDAVGNVTKYQIRVYIVDDTPKDSFIKTGKARFISKEYFPNTLDEDSIWIKNDEYYNELNAVLNNKKVDKEIVGKDSIFGDRFAHEDDATGHWETAPQQVWEISNDDKLAMREFIKTYGFSNYKHADGLKKFVEQFRSCRVK